jgi:hypothetical protein
MVRHSVYIYHQAQGYIITILHTTNKITASTAITANTVNIAKTFFN